ncbi:MAG: HAD-IIIA family hydrolase [Patescibacteria group bacterium]|nr:HAD-IIIA family hydrolase [Patescibacteria group bacterium]
MHKAIFFDKDNVIIKKVPYNAGSKLIKLREFAGEGLRLLKQAGFKLIMVMDQPEAAAGSYLQKDLKSIFSKIQKLLQRFNVSLDGFYYYPCFPEEAAVEYNPGRTCRKPRPGMLFSAAKNLDLDLSGSWMVGGILPDVETGNRAGCNTVLVNNGGETEWKWHRLSRRPDFMVSNLLEAAYAILTVRKKEGAVYKPRL